MDQGTNLQHISPDELIERLWTELQLVRGIASDGFLSEAWPRQSAALAVLDRAQWPVGSNVELIFSALGERHSQGEHWLQNTFSQMSRYERKGGGLEIDADPVPFGLRPREGVEWGCGQQACRECYELDRTLPNEYIERQKEISEHDTTPHE